jgi:hypothetical protein
MSLHVIRKIGCLVRCLPPADAGRYAASYCSARMSVRHVSLPLLLKKE